MRWWGALLVYATWWVCEGGEAFAADGIPRESEGGFSPDSRQGRIGLSPRDGSGYPRQDVHRRLRALLHRVTLRSQDGGQLRQVSPSVLDVTSRSQDGVELPRSDWLRQVSPSVLDVTSRSQDGVEQPGSDWLRHIVSPSVLDVTSRSQDGVEQPRSDWLRQVSPSVLDVTSRSQDGVEQGERRAQELTTTRRRRPSSVSRQVDAPDVGLDTMPLTCRYLSQLVRSFHNDDSAAVYSAMPSDRRYYVIHPRALGKPPTGINDYPSLQNEGIERDVVLKKYIHPVETEPTSQLNDESLRQVESYDQPAEEFYHHSGMVPLLYQAESYDQPAQEFYRHPLSLLRQAESYDQPTQQLHHQPLSPLLQTESYYQPTQELHHQPLLLLHQTELNDQPGQEFPLPLLPQTESYDQPGQESYNQPLREFERRSRLDQQVADDDDLTIPTTEYQTVLVRGDEEGLHPREKYRQQPPLGRQVRIEDIPLPSPPKTQLFFRRARPDGEKRQIRIHQCYFNPVACFRK